MGTFSKGILGGFSGTVGTVVGGNWKGIDYMRSQSSKRTGGFTQPQLEQQAKFALIVKFVQTMTAFVAISFRDFAVQMTGFNNAVSYNLKNAITGVYPNYSLLYNLALVSRGDLPNALGPTAIAAAGGKVVYSWTDNTGVGRAKATDLAMLLVYCPALNMSIYTTGSAARSAVTDTLTVSTFSGQTVETYIAFISADGKDIASSIYTGQVIVS